GWMEVFPGGVLRPEVLGPLGVEVPVLAWGIGVMRLAMVALGCNDIRELFQEDLAPSPEGARSDAAHGARHGTLAFPGRSAAQRLCPGRPSLRFEGRGRGT